MIISNNLNTNNLFKNLFVQPYAEGIERIKRCSQGIDYTLIDNPKLSLADRSISVITGLLLLVPVLNTILWLFIKLATPQPTKVLSEPARPWDLAIEAAKRQSPPPQVERVHSPAVVVNEYAMEEKRSGIPDYESTVRRENHPELNIVIKNSIVEKTQAIYSSEGNLTAFYVEDIPMGIMSQFTRAGQTVTRTGSIDNQILNETHDLEDPSFSWIQDPSYGFNSFTQEPEREKKFYAIHPLKNKMYKMRALKQGRVDLPGYGNVLKIVIRLNSGLFKGLDLATSYHDLNSGEQVQLNYGRSPGIKGEWKIKNQL